MQNNESKTCAKKGKLLIMDKEQEPKRIALTLRYDEPSQYEEIERRMTEAQRKLREISEKAYEFEPERGLD